MPSILGSALYEISKPSFFDRKFVIFFSKFIKSSSENAFASDNIGTLWFAFLKFFEGLCPTDFEGEFFDFKNSYLFSKSVISFFKSSYSLSETIGSLLSK